MTQYIEAAINLYQYIVAKHWNGQALIGPDPGIRFNYRIGRFIKSYLRHVHWKDSYYYLQAQGYWALSNWALFVRTNKTAYRDVALCCSDYMLSQQRDDGAWDYPNPEWKGRVATNEGTWGALGLLESYRHSTDQTFLKGALDWHKYLIGVTGFQAAGDELAINYFAGLGNSRVPNNSITVLRFFAELTSLTRDKSFMKPSVGLLNFIRRVQKPTGEFPYAVKSTGREQTKSHFQCYQYNAFECLNLIRYYEITGDEIVLAIITKLLGFLSQGLAEAGYAFYDCHNRYRTVTYHTAVLGAAFSKAAQLGLTGYNDLAAQARACVLRLQRPDGGFIHSQRDYHLLADQRSYPRYLTTILYHLLHQEGVVQNEL